MKSTASAEITTAWYAALCLRWLFLASQGPSLFSWVMAGVYRLVQYSWQPVLSWVPSLKQKTWCSNSASLISWKQYQEEVGLRMKIGEIAGKDRVKQSIFITRTAAALQRNKEKSCSQKRFPSVALVSFTMARVSNLGVTWSFPITVTKTQIYCCWFL